tara:strand:+ start:759 stop:941 length:183 start_codon:yes stop_codon:yes gene_type:complete
MPAKLIHVNGNLWVTESIYKEHYASVIKERKRVEGKRNEAVELVGKVTVKNRMVNWLSFR